MGQKPTGPKRNTKLEARVVYLRSEGLPFSKIAEAMGFKRQRAHAIYSRWKREVENEAE